MARGRMNVKSNGQNGLMLLGCEMSAIQGCGCSLCIDLPLQKSHGGSLGRSGTDLSMDRTTSKLATIPINPVVYLKIPAMRYLEHVQI
jgi:hypothetical protein